MRQIIIDFGTFHLLDWTFSLRIYGYGLMLVLGFLTSIALAQWRARRMGESTEIIAHCGVLCVVGGILGARIAYVIQHWEHFSRSPNVLGDMLDVTSGGLIYYGGVVLAILFVMLYLWHKKAPIRRYLDILAVSVMVGLAFGRAGCLLNGCCYGAQCDAKFPLEMSFPMYSKPLLKVDSSPGPFAANIESPSPVYSAQYEKGRVAPDERLTYLGYNQRLVRLPAGQARPFLLTPSQFHGQLTNDQTVTMYSDKEEARKKFESMAGYSGLLDKVKWGKGLGEKDGFLRGSELWQEALLYDENGDGKLNFDEAWNYLQARRLRLEGRFAASSAPVEENSSLAARRQMNEYLQADLFALAGKEHAHPVKPSQALGIINALLLAVLLAIFFRLRTREGQVFALMLVLYPATRFVEELIRDDNAHNLWDGVLTHNQYTSMILIGIGVILFWVLRRLPPSAGPAFLERLTTVSSMFKDKKPKRI